MDELLLIFQTISVTTDSVFKKIEKNEEEDKMRFKEKKEEEMRWLEERKEEEKQWLAKRKEEKDRWLEERKEEEEAWLKKKETNSQEIWMGQEKINQELEKLRVKMESLQAEHRMRSATSSSSSSSPPYSPSTSPSPSSTPVPEPRPVQEQPQQEDLDFGDIFAYVPEFAPVQVKAAPVKTDSAIVRADASATPAVDAPSSVPQASPKQILTKADAREALKTASPSTKDFLEIFVKCLTFFSTTEYSLKTKTDGKNFDLNELKVPTLFKSSTGLGIKTKEGISFESLKRDHGEVQLPVIKSLSNKEPELMELGQFFDRIGTAAGEGLNVLSFVMENIGSRLANAFKVPDVVSQNSWVDRTEEKLEEMLKKVTNEIKLKGALPELKAEKKRLKKLLSRLPKLEKFLLLSSKGSFTDVHVDMAATSVFYHVLVGKKIFFVAKPTEENMAAYLTSECRREDDVWLGSKLFDKFQKIEINAGETAMIPAGWIHFVYTPEDSIVFGGNFLCDQETELQLRFGELERQLIGKRIMKARNAFTNFEHTVFTYAATVLPDMLENKTTTLQVGGQILAGLRRMIRRNAKGNGEQEWRNAVVSKLRDQLAKSVHEEKLNEVEFFKSPAEYEFPFAMNERTKSRKRSLIESSVASSSTSAKRQRSSAARNQGEDIVAGNEPSTSTSKNDRPARTPKPIKRFLPSPIRQRTRRTIRK